MDAGTIMSQSDLPPRSEGPDGGRGSACDIDEFMVRAQHLSDAVLPWDGYPLEWHVEAWLIGDMNALAAVAILERGESDSGG